MLDPAGRLPPSKYAFDGERNIRGLMGRKVSQKHKLPDYSVTTQKIMLRVHRFMSVGTLVHLHLDGNFSLWKVFCCIATGDTFHLGLELVQLVSRVG